MTTRIYFDPLNKACKNIIGAVKEGEKLSFNLYNIKNDVSLLKDIKLDQCEQPNHNAFFNIHKDNEEIASFPMLETDYGWTISLAIHEIGLYYYSFYIENVGFISCGNLEKGHLTNKAEDFLLTVYAQEYQTPDWFKGGVMYQIFPDRFCKEGATPDIIGRIVRHDWGGQPTYRPNEHGKILNNDFFGGNFKGIEKKLPYLKDLGVTIIYFNPIFEAASNHRYDTANYMKIDPILGSEEDFDELIEAAKKYDIRVILDGVFNHTGDNSVYFNKYGKYDSLGAYQSKDSPYYSWYCFDEFPDKYSSWWGIDILPEVNENSIEYQNFIFGKDGVLKNWLKHGIGGYRLDVADELPDFFLKKLRNSVKESNPDAIIIGEVWEDASDKIAYAQRREYLQGYELDSVMNYPLKDAIIDYIQTGEAEKLLACVRMLINHYPKQTIDCLMNILGTHDTARILTVLGGIHCKNKDEMASPKAYMTQENKAIAVEKLKMAAVLQFTLPGVPCIYYGDENATEGHGDPFCRTCFDWEHLNCDLINFYKKLGEIRNKYIDIFKTGEFKEIMIDGGLFVYKRQNNAQQKIYIYSNNSSKSYLLKTDGKYVDLLKNISFENKFEIKANSFGIIIKEN